VKKADVKADVVVDETLRDYRLKKGIYSVNDLYKMYSSENYLLGITIKGRDLRKYIGSRISSGIKDYNNIYGLVVIPSENGSIELYINNKLVKDDDNINTALTGRQQKFDKQLKSSGIAYGKVYYNSYTSYGYNGRIRQRIAWYIKNIGM
jgi:hypothetical protein